MADQLDAYEQRFMKGASAMLYRDKFVIPRWLLGLFAGLPFLITPFIALSTGSLIPLAMGAFVSAIYTTIGLLFASARLMVTDKEIIVQFATMGPRIPIEEITSCEVVPYDTQMRRGVGIRGGIAGLPMTIRMWGDKNKAVKLTRRGKSEVLFVTRDPEGLATAIKKAMGAGKTSGVNVRVEDVALAEQELERELETQEKRRDG